jgi:hypothetical protein
MAELSFFENAASSKFVDNHIKHKDAITFCTMTFSILTFSILTFSILTFSITINKS